ncbi:MAG: penicillin-binding protein [Solirubrobacteraceae bacterium]|jgi:peptidoglycan glycosyltransferase|nr:penicillin-binding protein [Solirubrobacteraceae bacterium]
MNVPISRVFGLFIVLFALLIAWTSRWTVFDAKALRDNPLNARTIIDQEKIDRGQILAADGTVLAKSVNGPDHTFGRTYPTGSLFSQSIGYAYIKTGQAAGLELSDGDYLRGVNTGISAIIGQLGGGTQVGDNVYTTLDPKAQRLALQLLAGRPGSVVALDPRTGAIKAMVSLPSYNDNHLKGCFPPSCSQLNAATQAHDVAGSTFKLVTTVAALDSGKFTPSSVVDGKSPILVSGVPLQNDGNQSWGPQNLTTALTYSINTIFAQVAQQVGRPTMTQYMKRFGFYAKPPIDLPPDELFASRPYSLTSGKPYPPASPNEDIGRIGIGQGGLLVTPMQMAMVAAAVANGGKLMAPHLTDRVVNPDGQTVLQIKPTVFSQVMSPTTAQVVAQMMRKVVEEGTGQPANLGGISVAGKTGTASIGANGSNITEPWFVGFAPAQSPQIVVAVTIDRTQGQFGGTVAAPIAAAIMKLLLSEHG